jgi:hypothetical protein
VDESSTVYRGTYGPPLVSIPLPLSEEFTLADDDGSSTLFSQATRLNRGWISPILRRCIELWQSSVSPRVTCIRPLLKGFRLHTRVKMRACSTIANCSTHIFDTARNVNVRTVIDEDDAQLLSVKAIIVPWLLPAPSLENEEDSEDFETISKPSSHVAICQRYASHEASLASDNAAPYPLVDRHSLLSEDFPFQILKLDSSTVEVILVTEFSGTVNIVPVEESMTVTDAYTMFIKLP